LRRAAPLDAGTLASHPLDLDLPAGIPSRVKQLSDRLVAGQTTEYDRVAAVTGYLQTHYRYSLDTPRLPAGHDAVDEFLFVDHVGFCEQFASALAVTLREEKVPARLAVGYSTGEPNSFTGSFTVRAKDAHAWVEVLFPGTGWVPFDASPGFDSEPIAHNPARWFLSDVSASIPIFSHVNLGQSAASLAVVIPALALVLFLGLVVRRRRALSPELRAYLAAQRWLKITGLPIRRVSQTPGEHLAALAISQPDVAAVLRPLVRALEAAVYGRRREPTMARASAIASRALRWRLRGLRSDRR
jgi:hypothetical protein